MNINELYLLCQDLANKDQNGGLTAERFNRFAEQAQLSVYMNRYGNPNLYQPGRAIPLIAYPMTQKVSDDLLPFLVADKEITLANGIGDVPPDYLHIESLTANDSLCDVVSHAKFTIRAKSKVVPPDQDHPIANLYYDEADQKKKIKVLPDNPTDCKMSYLRLPSPPKWGYDITDGVRVYQPTKSKDFEMPQDTHLEICLLILQFYGINIDHYSLVQYAANKQTA